MGVEFQSGEIATPAPGTVAETLDYGAGQRQVVEIGSIAGATPALDDSGALQVALGDVNTQLSAILNVLASALGTANDPASGRIRILIDAITSGTTFTTTPTTIGGIPANQMVFDTMQMAHSTEAARWVA